jgi:hypothetical protein
MAAGSIEGLLHTQQWAMPEPDVTLSLPVQAFEVSAEEFKKAEQKQGTLLPLTAEKPALELVKVTKDMKVGSGCGSWCAVVVIGRRPDAQVFFRVAHGTPSVTPC